MLFIYFILRLIIALAVAGLLLYYFIRMMSKRLYLSADHPVMFFLPLLLSLVLTWFSATNVVPKMLDLKNLYHQNYKVATVEIRHRSKFWGTASGDREEFHYSPLFINLEEGKTYKISYTTYSHYIMSVE